MNLRQIEAFKTVMLAGSVTAAAELLNTTQPTISKLIAQLEAQTKLQLFDRTRGRLVPRREAHSLFKDVERALSALEEVGRSASQLARTHAGHIRIACIPSVGSGFMPRAVTNFLKSRPKTKATLYVRSASYVTERISGKYADIGFASEGPPGFGTTSTCFHDRPGAVCILPPFHRLREKKVLEPKDFVNEPFISVGRDTPFRYAVNRAFADAGIEQNIIIETNHFMSAYALVAQGAGVGILDPFTVYAYYRKGQVVVRPFSPEVKFVVNLLQPANHPVPLIVEQFLAHLEVEHKAMIKQFKELVAQS